MTDLTLRRSIQETLAACEAGPFAERARGLLGALGYRSDRWVEVGPPPTSSSPRLTARGG